MKFDNLNKKLLLNKKTVADLTIIKLADIKGGMITIDCSDESKCASGKMSCQPCQTSTREPRCTGVECLRGF